MLALLKYSEALKRTVNSINETSFQNKHVLELDCAVLPSMGAEGDCRYNPVLKDFFEPLMLINQPVLYWFDINSDHTANEIYEQLKSAKSKINRNMPAYKKGFNNWKTKVLYVGKVKRGFCGRMIVHLGYYKVGATQGLQLCHWSQELRLKLRLNYIVLPNELMDLAELFEKNLAKELSPIFGKHK